MRKRIQKSKDMAHFQKNVDVNLICITLYIGNFLETGNLTSKSTCLGIFRENYLFIKKIIFFFTGILYD